MVLIIKSRILFLIIAAVLFLPSSYAHAVKADTEISAQAYVLMEASSGRVLEEKNADDRMLIASTTKVMTALVVLDNCSAEESVLIRPEYTNIEGSSMYLRSGERYTVRELLTGLLLASGNDAAVALACHTAGSIEAFSCLMNEKAAEMGLKNTSFRNPHGLDEDGHYSSARDLARIFIEAMNKREFSEITSLQRATVGNKLLVNHNKLLKSCAGVIGGKTGFTKAAGRTLVTCCEREGIRLVCVTLRAPDDWADHSELYDSGFSEVTLYDGPQCGEEFMSVPVISGAQTCASVYAAEDISFPVFNNEKIECVVYLPEFVYADVLEGETAGEIVYKSNGKVLCCARLEYADTVLRNEPEKRSFFSVIKDLLY